MRTSFQLSGIDHEPFELLFSLPDEALKQHGAVRRFAQESPGYPCRGCLEDAAIGEELLLLPYLHQPAASPHRSSGPVFVRRGAKRRRLPVGEVPSYITRRLIFVRAYDADHMMVAARVCEGVSASEAIAEHFAREDVAYIQLHNAQRGCFACNVVRA